MTQNIGILQKRLVHGMFVFIIFGIAVTSVVLMMFIQVTADIDDMQNSSIFVTRKNYLREQLGK